MSWYIASDPANKICVVMVGLPGRGKSFMTQKLVRYMSWQSIKAKSFNVGSYRRMVTLQPNAEFFSNDNVLGKKLRKEAAHAAMVDLLNWLFEEDGRVAVYDATNSTRERRQWIKETLEEFHVHPLFVETICDDKDVILHTVADVKTDSPDYAGMDPQKAIDDFMKRIDAYKSIYETISSSERVSYVKIKNIGTQVVVHHIKSYLESHIVYYLMNLHIKPRRLWLSRHGESQFNLTGQLGGDADLTDRGMLYAQKLPSLLKAALNGEDAPLTVWTSTLQRTQQTAQYLPYPKIQWKALDELDAGVCDGLTYEEIKNKYPEDFYNRDENKFEYRYRGGESYYDVTTRLDPIIMELERQENIMIVTHQAVLRCIYAYFMNVPPESSPWLDVPLHTLICLQPGARGTVETRISANIPAVSTFRSKGEIPKANV
ncbi:fructose-2,6-bisphosphatase [Starmerella bacillaris]|uniref:fructose-2,6-bisphosphate 2-phosphatase n=1 Tax=Starmerella bacillaris TaxID=1247836 RepID=A0AAV5RI17_STABA|nr:fructose-2,6-bisphosphatase [Starmerella bacillaris]